MMVCPHCKCTKGDSGRCKCPLSPDEEPRVIDGEDITNEANKQIDWHERLVEND